MKRTICFLVTLVLFPIVVLGYQNKKPNLVLKSGITKEWKYSFVLKEDDLRRIYSELENAKKELPHPSTVVFYVKRSDKRYYETTDIDNVISDPNTDNRQITDLFIELRDSSPDKKPIPWFEDFIALVGFSKNTNKISLNISGQDKNWALLLSDKIEPNIDRIQKVKNISIYAVVLLILTAVFTVYLFINRNKYCQHVYYILTKSMPLGILIGFSIVLLFRPSFIVESEKWIKLFGPESCFYWGGAEESFGASSQLRNSIFWGILVAFIISMGANLLTYFVFKPKQHVEKHETDKTETQQPGTLERGEADEPSLKE